MFNNHNQEMHRNSIFQKLQKLVTDVTRSDLGHSDFLTEMMQVINAQNALITKLMQKQAMLCQELNKRSPSSDSSSKSTDKPGKAFKISGYGDINNQQVNSSGSPQEQEGSAVSNTMKVPPIGTKLANHLKENLQLVQNSNSNPFPKSSDISIEELKPSSKKQQTQIQSYQIMGGEKPVQKPSESEAQKSDKTYINSKRKWKDFHLHEDLIEALYQDNKASPTKMQSQTLEVTVNPERKRFNVLIRSPNGFGKTMSYIIPILNCIKQGLTIAKDKAFKGKMQKNEVFKPQGVIIVQTNFLQDRLQRILRSYQEFGESKKSEKLKFKIGRLDKEAHQFGDIIVGMPKSFLNRCQRGNLKFDNCKFIAIDEVDDIFEKEKQTLAQILKIAEANRPNVIACSATMKKQFLNFYEQHTKDFIKFNINENEIVQKLDSIKNYYKTIQTKAEMHKYIIGAIFKELYKGSNRPQIFIFFDSIEQIKKFHDYFKTRASDFTSDESEYLQALTVGIIAGKKYEDNKQVQMSIKETQEIFAKFRNNETNILLATNIIAGKINIRNACFVINVGPPKYSEKEADIDLDMYLHRVGLTGRHNDRGLALTFVENINLKRMVEGLKKTHKIDITEMKDPVKLVEDVFECIKFNSQ